MRSYKSDDNQSPSVNKLERFAVSFDLVLRKPSSERFSNVKAGDVIHKQ